MRRVRTLCVVIYAQKELGDLFLEESGISLSFGKKLSYVGQMCKINKKGVQVSIIIKYA